MKKSITITTLSFLFLSFLLSISSCGPDEKMELTHNVSFKIQGMVDHALFSSEQTYSNDAGQAFRLDVCDVYLSHIELVKTDGTIESIAEVLLYDLLQAEEILVHVPAGEYTAIRLNIGLDSLLNASDPATFERDHPLSFTHGTYWNWATQYRFLMLEGRVDSGETVQPLSPTFLYHIGTTDFMKTVNIAKDLTVSTTELTNITLEANIPQFFYEGNQPLDMLEQRITHTTNFPELAESVIQGFANALE